jgi:pantothenate kinase
LSTQLDLAGILQVVRQRGQAARSLTAIAGAPGSGKSTLAEALAAALNAEAPGSAAMLPMDGYHFDDQVLVPRGLRPRKGAPETFDVFGFHHMLQRLKRNDEPEVAVPVFDRDLEIARAGARIIPCSVRHLIVEGNYLLLDRPGWSGLRALFDTTIMIAVPEAMLRQRLTERWQSYRLPPDQVTAKVEANDLPNGRLILSASAPAEFLVSLIRPLRSRRSAAGRRLPARTPTAKATADSDG